MERELFQWSISQFGINKKKSNKYLLNLWERNKYGTSGLSGYIYFEFFPSAIKDLTSMTPHIFVWGNSSTQSISFMYLRWLSFYHSPQAKRWGLQDISGFLN